MRDWTYHDPGWRDRVGDSVDATVREALRRAIDMHDSGVSRNQGRPVLLVDVLNHLSDLL